MGAKTVKLLTGVNVGLAFVIATAAAFLALGPRIHPALHDRWVAVAVLLWLVTAILGGAFSVVHHADRLAHRLGEPYGTLVLTLSVTGMEVSMVSAIMLSGANNPTLARDTMFAVVMIVLGGLVGTALLAGGFRHRVQEFNLEGASAYLSLIVPLALIGMVMPRFTLATAGPTFSKFQSLVVAGVCFCSYAIFLAIQTLRHREYFCQEGAVSTDHDIRAGSPWTHAVWLLVSLVPVVFLAEELAHVLDTGGEALGVPDRISGMIVAALILAPEGLGGVFAAANNQLQRSINLLLGSALATIALTIPSVLTIGLLTNHDIVLGLEAPDIVLLAVTLLVSVMTFARGRTNVLQGCIHLLLFIVWVALLFES